MTQMPIETESTAPSIHEVTPDIAEPVIPGTSMTYLGGRPFRRYIVWYTIASLFITVVWGAVGAILLPNQVQAIESTRFFTGADANVDLTELNNLKAAVASGGVATAEQQRLLNLLGQFDASRAQALALVTALGVFGTMFVQPIVGVFSDRTRSRFGRRAPWILFGAVVGACFLVGLRFAPTIAVLALLWTLAQAILNMASGPLPTTIADRIPESKVATVSALGGMGALLGGVLGGVAAGLLFASLGLSIYLIIAALVVVGFVGFVVQAPDRPSTALSVAPQRWGAFFRNFLIPLRDSDFRLVWVARIVLIFGYSASTALALYMLQSYIHPALSAGEATQTAPLLSLAGLPFMLVTLMVAGRLSDKVGRRKPFVIAASLTLAVSMAVPLISPTLIAMFIQAALASIGIGIYLPVDQALFIDVLPDKNAAGRDLGIAALATNLGQALGPVLAGQVVALFASYGMVWAVALVLALVAAVVILPVKRVR
jgi:MFS family permease